MMYHSIKLAQGGVGVGCGCGRLYSRTYLASFLTMGQVWSAY